MRSWCCSFSSALPWWVVLPGVCGIVLPCLLRFPLIPAPTHISLPLDAELLKKIGKWFCLNIVSAGEGEGEATCWASSTSTLLGLRQDANEVGGQPHTPPASPPAMG